MGEKWVEYFLWNLLRWFVVLATQSAGRGNRAVLEYCSMASAMDWESDWESVWADDALHEVCRLLPWGQRARRQ